MRIKGLKTNETSFKTHRKENQTEDIGQNLEYDSNYRQIAKEIKLTLDKTK